MPKSSSLLAAPSLRVVPSTADDFTLGPLAVRLAAGYGLTADDWQADIVECSLCRRGKRFAAATVAVFVPRQNGKNGALEIRELFGMVVLGEKFLHTAHEVKTARKAFRRIAGFFENEREYPELAALVVEIRKTNGQEAIILSNGGSIEFIARSSGSGRGFTVDVLVCDEAQDLTDDELAALLPTISAAPLGNPQVILTGTPPDPEKQDAAKGEVIRRVRKDAQDGSDPALAVVDYGVPDGPLPDVDNRKLWHRVNPALGTRLNIAEVVRERRLMSPEKFARERLGWWGDPETDTAGPIDLAAWAALLVKNPPAVPASRVVLDVAPNRRSASIGIAGAAGDRILVAVESAGGMAWVVPRLVDLLAEKNILDVALHPQSQAGTLIPDLVAAGIEFETLTTGDIGRGCAWAQEAVKNKRLIHLGQPELDAAVANARTRFVSEAEVWDRRNRSIDISPAVAGFTAAHRWAEQTTATYDVLDSIF